MPAIEEAGEVAGFLARQFLDFLEARRMNLTHVSKFMPEGLRAAGSTNLAAFVALRPQRGEPVLVIAARFFFRRQVEEDPKLPLYIQTVRGVGYVLVPDRVS